MKLENQKRLILEKNWNVLIILDACRFDYFEKIYDNYIDGYLKKAISSGSSTDMWLKKTFDKKNFKDIVYISGNPYVNSYGIEVIGGFDGVDYFYKIIDAWDFGWDEKTKTVAPKAVSKATRMARAKHPNKKIISHFVQPHQPYLNLGPMKSGFSEGVKKAAKKQESFTRKFRRFAGKISTKILGWKTTYRFRRLLNTTEVSEIETVAKEYGKEGLRIAYEKNLESALKEVYKLIERLPDQKIAISSDHGEFLGEENIYGHHPSSDHEILRKVPWLEIKRKR